jgi:hypothetical protein
MAKWRLFGKSKEKEDEEIEQEPSEEDKPLEEESEDKPLAEYSETLHTGKPTSKKGSTSENISASDQRIWRDVESIEHKVDDLHKTKAKKPVTEVDKTVDKLIEKRKRK